MLTIDEFCDKHCACSEGREWALANCRDMQEAWDTAPIDWMIWIACQLGVLTDIELRKLIVWAARRVQHLLLIPEQASSVDALESAHLGYDSTGDARSKAVQASKDAFTAVRCKRYSRLWFACLCAAFTFRWAVRYISEQYIWLDLHWLLRESVKATVEERIGGEGGWSLSRDDVLAEELQKVADYLRQNTKPNFE